MEFNENDIQETQTAKKKKKKVLNIFLILFSILMFAAAIITPVVIFAGKKTTTTPDVQSGDYVLRYNATADCYDIVRYVGSDTEVVVPAEIDGIKVRSILGGAFDATKRQYAGEITSVTIEYGIESIGAGAFKGCSEIKEFTIPESVQSLGKNAFEGSGLEVLYVKDASVLRLMPGALDGAEFLETMSILGASKNGTISAGDLDNISNVTDLQIAEGIQVGADAFSGLQSITSLTVYNYSNLTVSSEAFENSNIITLNIIKAEDALTYEFMQKFSGLSNLQNVNIDKDIIEIKPEAFKSFSNLEKVKMGNGTKIDVSALPLVLTSSGKYKVEVNMITDADDEEFTLILTHDSGAVSYNVLSGKFLETFEYSKIKNVVLSENFTMIGDNAFVNYSQLSSLNFGENSKVTSIGTEAFSTDAIKGTDVVGPQIKTSIIYKQFNMSSGAYAGRKSYNGTADIGSYYVNLNYQFPSGKTNQNVPLKVEIEIGEKIINSLPADDYDNKNFIISDFRLDGWYTAASGGERIIDQTMTKAYNGSYLYARWHESEEDTPYKTEYYLQTLPGAETEYEKVETVYGWGKISDGDVYAVQKIYDGFSFNDGYSGNVLASKISEDGSTTLKVFYVRNTYYISFVLNDGTDDYTKAVVDFEGTNHTTGTGAVEVVVAKYGHSIALPTAERVGYTFNGWFNGVNNKIESGFEYSYTDNITLQAGWTKNAYTPKFTVEIYQETGVDEQGNKIYTRNTESPWIPTNISYGIDDFITPVPSEFKDITNKVTYELQDFIGYTLNKNVEGSVLGKRMNGFATEDAEKENNVLKFYYDRNVYNVTVVTIEPVGVTTPLVKQDEKPTQFSIYYGETYYGETYSTGLPVYTREGYTVVYSTTNTGKEGTILTASTTAPTTFDEGAPDWQSGAEYSQTIYVVSKPNTYTIVFNGNGSDGGTAVENKSVTFDTPINLPENSYTKTDWHFVGWAHNDNAAVAVYSNAQQELSVNTVATNANVVNINNATITLYAVWKQNNFTVSFDGNGETDGGASSINVVFDGSTVENVALPSSESVNFFVKTGYTFAGWATTSTGAVVYADKATATNNELYNDGNDVTLYAVWTPNRYAITLAPNGGSGSEQTVYAQYDSSVIYAGATGDGVATITVPELAGYALNGWTTEVNGNVAVIAANGAFNANKSGYTDVNAKWVRSDNESVTLYAAWTANEYTVRFDGNNPSQTAGDVQNVPTDYITATYNQPISENDLAIPTLTGYTFNGWFLKIAQNEFIQDNDNYLSYSSAEGMVYGKYVTKDSQNLATGGVVTLYAYWTPGSVNYTVEYYQQNISNQNYTKVEQEVLQATADTEIQVTGASNKYNGFDYIDGTKDVFVNADGSTVVQLRYNRHVYNVSINIGDHATGFTVTSTDFTGEHDFDDLIAGSQNLPYGTHLTLSIVGLESGYQFNSWKVGEDAFDGTIPYQSNNGSNVVINADISAIIYTLTLDNNNATGGSSQASVVFNGQITTSITNPLKTGYNFGGWTIDNVVVINTLGHLVPDIDTYTDENANWIKASGETLVAKWIPKVYHVVFNANGGAFNVGAITEFDANYDQTYQVSSYIVSASKAGYQFAGFTGSDSTIQLNGQILNLAEEDDVVVTLTASWTANSYTIIYNANGGEGSVSSTAATYDQDVTLASNEDGFTRDGYTFLGWSKSQSGSKEYDAGQTIQTPNFTTENNGPFNLYAVWSANSYNALFNANGGTFTGESLTDGKAKRVVTYDSEFGTLPTITRTGYTFGGWFSQEYVDNAEVDNSKLITAETTVQITDTTNFYAYWTSNEGIAYTVEYYVENLAGTEFVIDGTQTVQGTGLAGAAVNATIKSISGFTYDEGNENEVLSGNIAGDGSTVLKVYYTRDIVVLTVSKDEKVASVVVAGDYVTPGANNTYSIKFGSTFTVTATMATGYAYAEYMYDGDARANGATLTMVAENSTITLTGTAITYYVEYNGNGETSGEMSQSQLTYDNLLGGSLSEKAYLKTGYSFDGWSLSQNGEVAVIAGTELGNHAELDTATVNALYGYAVYDSETAHYVVTLYVVWSANQYNVSFDGNVPAGTASEISGLPETINARYDANISAEPLGTPTLKGYTFGGWYNNAACTGDAITNTARNLDEGSASDDIDPESEIPEVVLYAKWTARQYIINFDGGNTPSSSVTSIQTQITATYDVAIGALENAVAPGYTFTGYYLDGALAPITSSVKNLVDNPAADGSSSVTVYAHWTANNDISYTVKYYLPDLNTGSNTLTGNYTVITDDTLTGQTGELVHATINPYPGFTYDSEDVRNNIDDNVLGDGSLELRVYYTRNQYTLTYAANGGVGSDIDVNNLYHGYTFNLAANPFTKNGYRFNCWNTEANGSGTEYSGEQEITITGNLTLYVQWASNDYEITFDGNVPIATASVVSGVLSPITVTFSQGLGRTLTDPALTGYTFNGWYLETNAETKILNATASAFIASVSGYTDASGNWIHNGNVTVYAYWTPNTYTVNFDGNDADKTGTATVSPAAISNIEYDQPISENALASATLDGYTFDGWFLENGTQIDNTATCLATGEAGDTSVTVYAHWTANRYEITLAPNGGSGSDQTVYAQFDSATIYAASTGDTAATITVPTKNGYTFAGWVEDVNDDIVIAESGIFSAGISGYTNAQRKWIRSNNAVTALEAKWTVNRYAITLDVNNATSGLNQTVYAQFDSATIFAASTGDGAATINHPTKTGYTFAGWTLTQNSTDVLINTSPEYENITGYTSGGKWIRTTDASITLYARWNVNTYTISYDPNSGEGDIDPQESLPYTGSVTLSTGAGFSLADYTLVGWALDPAATQADFDLGVTQYSLTDIIVDAEEPEITLYAVWRPNSDVQYKIQKYLQNMAGNGYENPIESIAYGTAGQTATITPSDSDYEGFSYNTSAANVTSGTISSALVLEAYYIRNSYTLTVQADEKIDNVSVSGVYVTPGANNTYSIKYGSTFTVTVTMVAGYNYASYNYNGIARDYNATLEMIADNVTIELTGTPKTFNVSYDGNGETEGEMANTALTYNDSTAATLRTNAFVKTGYTFAGWATTAGGSVAYVNNASLDAAAKNTLFAINNGDVTLYAVWSANKYTVSFNGNGGVITNVETPTDGKFTVYYGTTYTITDFVTVARTGYTLNGWNTNSTSNVLTFINLSTGVDPAQVSDIPNIEITAQWLANKYTVSFNGNGGTITNVETPTDGKFTVYYGTTYTITDLVTVAKDGYWLDDWTAGGDSIGFTFANLSTGVAPSATTGVPNSEITAAWEVNLYTIRYNRGVGSGEIASVTNKAYTDSITLSNGSGFTRTGYYFNGWTVGSTTIDLLNLTQNIADLADAAGVKAGSSSEQIIDLYAIWAENQYTIAYSANGGNGTIDSVANNGYESTITLDDGDDFTKTGYGLIGWSLNSGANNTVNYALGLANKAVKDIASDAQKAAGSASQQTITLYAVWQADAFTIEFNGNKPEGASGAIGGATTSVTGVTYDATATLTANGFVLTGYTFAGWATTAGGEVAYANGATLTAEQVNALYTTAGATRTLYAKWTADTFTVAFDGNKPASASGSVTGETTSVTGVTYDATATLTANGFALTGYTFAGWATTADGEVAYANSATLTAEQVNALYTTAGAIRTLYAKWTANTFEIMFNSNKPEGATGEVTGETESVTGVTYDATATLTLNGFELTGYTFAGWATTAGGEVAYTDGATLTAEQVNSLYVPGAAEYVLSAVWQANTYTITFDGNVPLTTASVVSGVLSPITVTFDQGLPSTLTDPSLTGYTFNGWYLENNNQTKILNTTASAFIASVSGYTDANANWIHDGNITVYAKWTANTYVAIFAPGTGTIDAPAAEEWIIVTTDNYNELNTTYGISLTAEDAGKAIQTVTYDAIPRTAPTASKTGYQLNSYACDPTHYYSLDGYIDGETTWTVDGNLTFTAVFIATQVNYTVNYRQQGLDDNYVIVGTVTRQYTAEQTTTVAESAADKEEFTGVSFDGFTYTGDLNNVTIAADGSTVVNLDYTRDSYLIGFNIKTFSGGNSDANHTGGSVQLTYGTTINSTVDSLTVPFGATVSYTQTANTGYSVAGLFTDAACTEAIAVNDGNFVVDVWGANNNASVTIYAKFTANTYTVTFNGNAPIATASVVSGVPSPITVTFNEALPSPLVDPSLTGYTFNGWYLESNNQTKILNTTASAFIASVSGYTDANANWIHDGNITVYAKWTAKTYTITFDANAPAITTGTVSGVPSQVTVTFDQGFSSTLTDPTLTGYTFNGWFLEDGQTQILGTNASAFIASVSGHTDANANWIHDGNITVYASWSPYQYTYTFDANEPEGTATGMPSNGSTSYDAVLSNGAFDTPSLTGFIFVEWNLAEDGNGRAVDNTSTNLTTTENDNVTIYAIWQRDTYTVTVVGRYTPVTGPTTVDEVVTDNNNTAGLYYAKSSDYSAGSSYTYAYHDSVTVETVAQTGWVFLGWYSSATPSGSALSTTLTHTFTIENGSVTVYAHYIPARVQVSVATAGIEDDGTATGKSALTPNIGGSATIAVVFTASSGATTAENQTTGYVYYGTTPTITATPAAGYNWIGWYSDSTCQTQVSANAQYNPTLTAPETTLYAKFEIKEIELMLAPYFEAASATVGVRSEAASGTTGGTVAVTGSATVNYGYGWTVEATPETGYSFVGWYDTNIFEGPSQISQNATYTFANQAANRIVYALFQINQYSVSTSAKYGYIANLSDQTLTYVSGIYGGTIAKDPITNVALYNQVVTLSATPATGYSFDGWYDTNDTLVYAQNVCVENNGTYSKQVTVVDNVDLYARFSLNKYDLSLAAYQQSAATATTLGALTAATAGTYGGTVQIGTNSASYAVNVNDTYYSGQAIQITATAVTGYTFAGWYKDAACTEALEAYSDTTGAVPEEYTYMSATRKYTGPAYGVASVTLYAKFVQTAYTIEVTAQYQAPVNEYTLGSLTNGTTGGTVSFTDSSNSNADITPTPVNGVYTVSVYNSINIAISTTPATHYHVDSANSNVPAVSVTVSGNESYTVVFIPDTFTVTAVAKTKTATGAFTTAMSENGTLGGTVTNGVFYYYGDGVTLDSGNITGINSNNLTATPADDGNNVGNSDYQFVGWFTDSTCDTAATLTTGSITVYGLFIPKTYEIYTVVDDDVVVTSDYYEVFDWAGPGLEVLAYANYTWTGDVPLPVVSKSGFTLARWVTNDTTVTSQNLATLAGKSRIVISPEWVAAREGNVYAISRTPESMHGSTVSLQDLSGLDSTTSLNGTTIEISTMGNTPTASFSATSSTATAISAPTIAGYTFQGWYYISDLSDYDILYSRSDVYYLKFLTSNSTYTFETTYTAGNRDRDWGTGIKLFMFYTPNQTVVTVETYYLNASENVVSGTTGGTVSGVTIGSTNVSLASTATPGRYTFTAYLGGLYTITGTPATHYELIGFTTDNANPTMSDAEQMTTFTDVNIYPSDSAGAYGDVQLVFAGEEYTITFDKHLPDGVTDTIGNDWPSSVNVRYGVNKVVALEFSAYAIEFWQHVGFDASSEATNTNMAITRFGTASDASSVTISATATTTLYAVWYQPEVWVEAYSDSSMQTRISVDDFEPGFTTLESAYTAINTGNSIAATVVTVLRSGLSISGAVSITKPTELKGISAETALSFTSTSSISLTSNSVNIYGITLNGYINFNVGSSKTLTIGKVGFETFINAATPTANTTHSIFELSGGTLNIVETTITNGVVGIAEGYGGIISASSSSIITMTDTIIINNTSYAKQLFYINGSAMTVSGCNIGIDADGETAGYNAINGTEDYAALFVVEGAATLTLGSSSDAHETNIATNGYRVLVLRGSTTTVSAFATIDSVLVDEEAED